MVQIGLAALLIMAIAYFINESNKKKRLSQKEDELKQAELDTDILDIDKNIEQERAYQRDLKKDIDTLKKGKK